LLTIGNQRENVVQRCSFESIEFIEILANTVSSKIESVAAAPQVFQQKGPPAGICGTLAPALDDL
jgi:hypothetical protein